MKEARPWDLLFGNRAPTQTSEYRMDICKGCTSFIKLTGQCKECKCIMIGKTKLADAWCPLDHWGPAMPDEEED